MTKKENIAYNLYKKHIKGTTEKAIVVDIDVFLCHLTTAVLKIIEQEKRVYLNSKALKHLYDKKPAEEFEFILNNLQIIVEYPEHIYKNKNPKRGHYIFSKSIQGKNYLCSLESKSDGLWVVTAFRVRDKKYLNDYNLLWSWKGGTPSS